MVDRGQRYNKSLLVKLPKKCIQLHLLPGSLKICPKNLDESYHQNISFCNIWYGGIFIRKWRYLHCCQSGWALAWCIHKKISNIWSRYEHDAPFIPYVIILKIGTIHNKPRLSYRLDFSPQTLLVKSKICWPHHALENAFFRIMVWHL